MTTWSTGTGRLTMLAAIIGFFAADAGSGGASGRQHSADVTPRDSNREMVAALGAQGPHPALGDRAGLFDRFVGTWDADYAQYTENGGVTRQQGEVIFGWIIDGHALQDIWIWYPGVSGQERGIGTTVRFFDKKSDTWRVIWISPHEGRIVLMQGGAVDGRIVLVGTSEDGSSLRWSFNDILPASFIWRGERSRDGGTTWLLTAEYHMTRRGVAPPKP